MADQICGEGARNVPLRELRELAYAAVQKAANAVSKEPKEITPFPGSEALLKKELEKLLELHELDRTAFGSAADNIAELLTLILRQPVGQQAIDLDYRMAAVAVIMINSVTGGVLHPAQHFAGKKQSAAIRAAIAVREALGSNPL